MNFFKTFTLKWWQTGLFKLLLLSLGIVIGATWPVLFAAWRPELLVIFLMTTVYITYVWYKQ